MVNRTSLGMHLLYYGEEQISFLKNKTVGGILADLSQRQGSTYDSPDSVKSIPSFISTYSIQVSELRFPDLSHYKSFNEFFYRQLREDARPIQNADDPDGFCSAADCRLTVYQTCELAREFWVKGNNFTIPNLLGISPESDTAHTFSDGSLAIFRLAPADYHRFHCPLDGLVGWDSGDNTEGITDIPGEYFTVNPQAVNEPGFDVFTANRRAVLYLKHEKSGLPVAFVAIGAMLVGSIIWTGGKERGRRVKKGDELGYVACSSSFRYFNMHVGLTSVSSQLLRIWR
jgi:phosphatidylserine decarboxylase